MNTDIESVKHKINSACDSMVEMLDKIGTSERQPKERKNIFVMMFSKWFCMHKMEIVREIKDSSTEQFLMVCSKCGKIKTKRITTSEI